MLASSHEGHGPSREVHRDCRIEVPHFTLVKTAFLADLCITPLRRIEHAVVLVEDGVVRDARSRDATTVPTGTRQVNLGAHVLAPGYVDLHIHGGAGHDVMEGTASALAHIEQHLARTGVSSYVPTTVTAPLDTTLRALDRLADAIEGDAVAGRARPVGIHLEGPFISHEKRGVHPPQFITAPSVEVFEQMWHAARGHVRLLTVAPELPEAGELIAEASRRGVTVSLGHSNASLIEARAGIRAGARHATHTFNAMRPLDHREPGIVGAVLADRDLSAEIIADGVHVAPEIIKLFLEAKGRERAVLVTDAISATGMPDGPYQLGSFTVEVSAGVATLDGKLAGSVLTLDRAVRNVMAFAGWRLDESVRLATINPAMVIHLADGGIIEPGARADFVVLDRAGNVVNTIIGGQPLLD
jgi:N-acetylglucosamine-6-phosphate deacetylase